MSVVLSDKAKSALVRVAEWLENGAPHVDVNGRTLTEFDMEYSVEANACGTACCIAGAISQFEGLIPTVKENDSGIDWSTVQKNVEVYLGGAKNLNALKAYREQGDTSGVDAPLLLELHDLFMPFNHFATEHYNDHEVAAKVIREFIRTGEVQWDEIAESLIENAYN